MSNNLDNTNENGPLADLFCEDCIVRVARILGVIQGTLDGLPGPLS